jgi:hypothetical protein
MSLNANRITLPLLPLVLCATLSGCASGDGKGGYVPPEALASPSAKMSEGLSAFTTSVQTKTLANYRRAQREDTLRAAIRDVVMAKQLSIEDFHRNMPTPLVVLCKARYSYVLIATPVEVTAAKAEAVKELLTPPSSDIKELLKATRTKFTIDVTEPAVLDAYDSWLMKHGRPCAIAVEQADPFVVRASLTQEAGAGTALVAFNSLIETVWAIVKPALVGTLQNAEIERRNRAVRDFFADTNNTKALKADIIRIEDFLQKEFDLQSKRNAGISVSSLRILTNFSDPHWTKAMAIADKGQCRESIRNLAIVKLDARGAKPERVDSKTDPAGVTCLNNVYAALAVPMKTALDAADAFDEIMDRQLPQQKLSAQVDIVSDLAQGKMSDEARMRAMWGVLVRYATLFDTIHDTASEANKKKLDDATEALGKTLQ